MPAPPAPRRRRAPQGRAAACRPGDEVDRLAVEVVLQRAERDRGAVGRPAGEEPAAPRVYRVLAARANVDDEKPLGPDPAPVAQVLAPRRAEDDRTAAR